MMDKKVELLAPAGNYQALVGAINAGADAIYLGGEKFSARAYAANFTDEEIVKALHYAHIWGKKLYLAVNTLVKEREFSLLYDYISPFYEAGLDGVIIQDLGVWHYMREMFPALALHASTQMAITGEMGAMFLKQEGASRIVPARELSLTEIKNIKQKTALELECFIHGAMCYSYSGQCLFSSILGGRSGNRGRCAQPCRLPYHVLSSADEPVQRGSEFYPLSLKDMCTIEFIPKLIQAGIDSFKIEGRMKKPEYVAGVTAIYRKYIDAYYQNGEDAYLVTREDMDKLRKLYIRTELQTGYYDKHNGKDMITLGQPGYQGADDNLLQEIAEAHLKEEKTYPVSMHGIFRIGEPACLSLESGNIHATVYGHLVEPAQKRPLTKEDILKQLHKTGNSYFRITEDNITMDDHIFMPVGQINELRRNAAMSFAQELSKAYGLTLKRSVDMQDPLQDRPKTPQIYEKPTGSATTSPQLHVMVCTHAQLEAVCQYTCDRVYIDSDYYIQEFDQISRLLEQNGTLAIYLALPYVVRAKDVAYFQELCTLLHASVSVKGFLVRNLESVFWVRSLSEDYELVTDTGLYCYNAQAARFFGQFSKECYLPYELNNKECRGLLPQTAPKMSVVVYGTIPMMVSANCVRKTTDMCQKEKKSQKSYLRDRYHTVFPVLCNCNHCYNIIYNSLPYSLHQKQEELCKLGVFSFRLDFVWEDQEQVKEILDYYTGKRNVFPVSDYTTGHYKRGVE